MQGLQRLLTEGQGVVNYCDFEGMMNDGELKHLCQQVGGSEGAREEGQDGRAAEHGGPVRGRGRRAGVEGLQGAHQPRGAVRGRGRELCEVSDKAAPCGSLLGPLQNVTHQADCPPSRSNLSSITLAPLPSPCASQLAYYSANSKAIKHAFDACSLSRLNTLLLPTPLPRPTPQLAYSYSANGKVSKP